MSYLFLSCTEKRFDFTVESVFIGVGWVLISVAKSEGLRIMTWLKCGLKNVIFIMKI